MNDMSNVPPADKVKEQTNTIKRFLNTYKFEIVTTGLILVSVKNRKLRKTNVQLLAQIGEYRRLMESAVPKVQSRGLFDDLYGSGLSKKS